MDANVGARRDARFRRRALFRLRLGVRRRRARESRFRQRFDGLAFDVYRRCVRVLVARRRRRTARVRHSPATDGELFVERVSRVLGGIRHVIRHAVHRARRAHRARALDHRRHPVHRSTLARVDAERQGVVLVEIRLAVQRATPPDARRQPRHLPRVVVPLLVRFQAIQIVPASLARRSRSRPRRRRRRRRRPVASPRSIAVATHRRRRPRTPRRRARETSRTRSSPSRRATSTRAPIRDRSDSSLRARRRPFARASPSRRRRRRRARRPSRASSPRVARDARTDARSIRRKRSRPSRARASAVARRRDRARDRSTRSRRRSRVVAAGSFFFSFGAFARRSIDRHPIDAIRIDRIDRRDRGVDSRVVAAGSFFFSRGAARASIDRSNPIDAIRIDRIDRIDRFEDRIESTSRSTSPARRAASGDRESRSTRDARRRARSDAPR